MSSVHVFICGESPDAAMRAFRVAGDVVEDLGAARGSKGGKVVLVLPGTEVRVRRLTLDAKSDAQATSAARYLLSDTLAASDADVQVAIGEPQDGSGTRLVAVIASERLDAWIAACRACGGEPAAVYADFTVRTPPDGAVDVMERDGLCMVCAGPLGGYAIESDIASVLFRGWRETEGQGLNTIRLKASTTAAWREAAAGLGIEAQPAGDDPLLALARAAATPPAYAPDLRQGAFALEDETPNAWGIGRVAIALALLAFCVHTGAAALNAWRDGRAADATLAHAERDLRAARPDVGRIVNLRAQVAAMKADISRSGDHPVLALNPALVEALKATPSVRLDDVRHATPGRQVTLQVSGETAEGIDAFAAALKQKAGKVQLQARSPVQGRHAATIVAEAP